MSDNEEFSFELAQQLYSLIDQFPINFDDAWIWLGYSKKDKALKTLKNNFVEGEDFALLQEGEWSQGGRSSDLYGLSVNCFKEMGMMAGTEKGRAVRKHFLECERIAKAAMKQQPQSTGDMLLMFAQAFKEHEQRLAAIEQKNEEIKEQLEVVDMETSANTAELERFRNGHGFFFSIAGWCSKHGIKKPVQWMTTQGRKASALCKQKGLQPVPVSDPRFGQVNTYPDSVLSQLTWD